MSRLPLSSECLQAAALLMCTVLVACFGIVPSSTHGQAVWICWKTHCIACRRAKTELAREKKIKYNNANKTWELGELSLRRANDTGGQNIFFGNPQNICFVRYWLQRQSAPGEAVPPVLCLYATWLRLYATAQPRTQDRPTLSSRGAQPWVEECCP